LAWKLTLNNEERTLFSAKLGRFIPYIK
jgi:hypothetical protein